MAVFVGVAMMSLSVLWPRRWESTTDPRSVIKTYIEADEPALVEDARHDLSLYMHGSFVENQQGPALHLYPPILRDPVQQTQEAAQAV